MRFCIFIITLVLVSCTDRNRLIKEDGIKNISVHLNTFIQDSSGSSIIKQDSDSFLISNQKQISQLAHLINSSNRELVKFFPECSLVIRYSDTVIDIGLRNDLCKIDGVSYRMKENAAKYLQN